MPPAAPARRAARSFTGAAAASLGDARARVDGCSGSAAVDGRRSSGNLHPRDVGRQLPRRVLRTASHRGVRTREYVPGGSHWICGLVGRVAARGARRATCRPTSRASRSPPLRLPSTAAAPEATVDLLSRVTTRGSCSSGERAGSTSGWGLGRQRPERALRGVPVATRVARSRNRCVATGTPRRDADVGFTTCRRGHHIVNDRVARQLRGRVAGQVRLGPTGSARPAGQCLFVTEAFLLAPCAHPRRAWPRRAVATASEILWRLAIGGS